MFSTLNDTDMVECPYNKSHRMSRKRLQPHIIKCRVNYPDAELQKCPFNNTHLVPEPEFVHHVTSCPDRKLITQYKYDAPEINDEDRPKHAPIESEENWDDTEVEDYNPLKYAEKANILRRPHGIVPSERKAFIKSERKRLGDDSDEEDCNAGSSVKQPPTPPPPSWDDSPTPRENIRYRSRSPNMYRMTVSRRSPSPNERSQRNSPDYNLDDDPYYNGGSTTSSNNDDDYYQRRSRTSHYIYNNDRNNTKFNEHHNSHPYSRRNHYLPPRKNERYDLSYQERDRRFYY